MANIRPELKAKLDATRHDTRVDKRGKMNTTPQPIRGGIIDNPVPATSNKYDAKCQPVKLDESLLPPEPADDNDFQMPSFL